PALEDVDAVLDLAEAMAASPRDGLQPELAPLQQDFGQVLLARPAVDPDHHEVDRHVALEARVREKRVDELLLVHPAGARLEHEAYRRLLAGLVANGVEHRQHRLAQLLLLGRDRLPVGPQLRVGELLDLLEDLLCGYAVWQLVDDQLPLATGEVLDVVARPDLDRSTPAAIDRRDFLGRR